jgi:hypothetical protein
VTSGDHCKYSLVTLVRNAGCNNGREFAGEKFSEVAEDTDGLKYHMHELIFLAAFKVFTNFIYVFQCYIV